MTRILAMVGAAVLLVFSLGSVGCETLSEMGGESSGAFGTWKLTALGDNEVAPMLPEGMEAPSITISPDGTVSGSTGVNQMSASLDLAELAQGTFKMNPAAVTKMAGPAKAMALETKFIASLQEATGIDVSNNRLRLSRDDMKLATFQREK
ncbi:MAG: META domain-containing protein [Planctomycetota bacterium]